MAWTLQKEGHTLAQPTELGLEQGVPVRSSRSLCPGPQRQLECSPAHSLACLTMLFVSLNVLPDHQAEARHEALSEIPSPRGTPCLLLHGQNSQCGT